jgi:ArsR family transcriptional regulator
MSGTIAQARVKRLVGLGLVDTTCTPVERIRQLRARLEQDRAIHKQEEFYAALGDSTRLNMLKLIGDDELCSCEVMAALELTQPTTSHHLGILERAGILNARRNGKWVFYKIANPKVKSLLARGEDIAAEAQL